MSSDRAQTLLEYILPLSDHELIWMTNKLSQPCGPSFKLNKSETKIDLGQVKSRKPFCLECSNITL